MDNCEYLLSMYNDKLFVFFDICTFFDTLWISMDDNYAIALDNLVTVHVAGCWMIMDEYGYTW